MNKVKNHLLQREEVAEVKAERAALLASLAALKGDPGRAGGELQREDVRLLRKDLVVKLQKLNELKQVRASRTDPALTLLV